MSKKVISVGLNSKDIDRAMREIDAYKQELLKKMETYRKRLAEEIAYEAMMNFRSAEMNDVVKGSTSKPDVEVYIDEKGSMSVIVAYGEDAVFCEFGAGVYHNGSVGSSPHPKGSELGLTIGSYGKGYGKATAWGYYEDGELVITRGTPASMPMYNAVQTVAAKAITIAREVFG